MAKSTAEQTANGEQRFFTAPLLIIFLTVFVDLIGFGMVIPILPFYAETSPFNATPFEIGLLFSIYSWMQFFFAPVLGRLSDRFGRRPILYVSLLGSVAGYLMLGFADTLFLVFAGRVVSGITGGNISTAQAYVADITTRENRAKGMGLFGAAFGLGFILGPAIAGVLSKYSVQLPFFFAAVLSLISAAGVFFLLPETVTKDTAARRPSGGRFAEFAAALAERRFRIVNIIYFVLITGFSIMTYAFALFAAYRFAYTAEQVGYLFFFVGLISVVSQGILFGTLVRRTGETPLVAAGCLMMCVSLVLLPMVGPAAGGVAVLLSVTALLSLGNALASPALTSLASKVSSDDQQGSALGIMGSGASLARAIGPMIGGVLLNNAMDQVDDSTIYRTFWTAAAVMFGAFAIAALNARTLRSY